jgi:chaperonin GroES
MECNTSLWNVKKIRKNAMRKAIKKIEASPAAIGFRPTGDKVLIEPCTGPTMTDSGIALPEGIGETNPRGTVVAVGPGLRKKNGAMVPVGVKVGQVVWYPKYSGAQVDLGDKAYLIIRGTGLLGVEE